MWKFHEIIHRGPFSWQGTDVQVGPLGPGREARKAIRIPLKRHSCFLAHTAYFRSARIQSVCSGSRRVHASRGWSEAWVVVDSVHRTS